jgi:hypothetical protein
MWAIPKVGGQVIVMCLDGNPQHRVWMGCLHGQLSAHTMPHGRWVYDDHPGLEKAGSQVPYGPFTTTEHPIEPLSSNLQQAFGPAEQNFEWRTRAADYSVSAIDIDHLEVTHSKTADDKDVVVDGWTSRQGYQSSRTAPFLPGAATDRNYDSLVYSLTSPGFHSISMDDRQENCRIRLRTTGGHQFILDDTNERVYLATAQGKNWMEMDQAGNITAYTDGTYSVRGKGDINFTSDKTIRMHANGIHMVSTADICIQSTTDVNVKVGNDLKIGTSGKTLLTAVGDIGLTTRGSLQSMSLGITGIKATILQVANPMVVAGGIAMSGALSSTSGSSVAATIDGDLSVTGQIRANNVQAQGFNDNSPPPPTPPPPFTPPSVSPASANEAAAKWTSMVPDHEPYARVMTKDDYSHTPELAYNDANVGKIVRGQSIFRGRFWRR